MQQTTFALSDFHTSLSEPPGISGVFLGTNLPRDTVFFSEKYSICSIYFECLSDKLGIERRQGY
jgi:hypothetical protein